MMRTLIHGAMAVADDILIVTDDQEPVDVEIVPADRSVLAFKPVKHAVQLCVMHPCTDAATSLELVTAIRVAARANPAPSNALTRADPGQSTP
jgi:hypothetical protein